jgi:hypothetical protein
MNPEESEIKQAMEQMRSDTPAELKARLRMLASSTKGRKPSPWPARLALAGAGATLVAIIAISLSPSDASAKSFDMVIDATRQARSFSIEAIRYQGEKASHMSVAFTEGRIVMRTGGDWAMLMDSNTMKMYNTRTNVVSEMPLGGSGNSAMFYEVFRQRMAQMDITTMLKNWRTQYGDANITVGPILRKDGRNVYDVTLLRPGEKRTRISVDADTDLPAHVESDKAQGSDWKADMTMDVRYGEDAISSLSSLTVPANAKVIPFDFSIIQAAMKGMSLGSGANPGSESPQLKEMMRQMMESLTKRAVTPNGGSTQGPPGSTDPGPR